MQVYRGLILDFGGVITTDFYGALRDFSVREGLGDDAVGHVLRRTAEGRTALTGVEDGRLPQKEFEATLARLLGVDAAGLLGRILADLQPCEEVLEMVARARRKGIATAVLSNSWGTGSYDPYAGYDLEDRFDAVVISDQVRLSKPDEEIYRFTSDKMGLPPSACVFVDDTAHNLPPAERLGMAGVLFEDAPTALAQIAHLLQIN
ncbi:putative hydrolase of the HAD superfamily/hydrolase [Sinosporangium album]|uniref:Putative hydrolase of the HAD superfamily/hydrolase n=1 Tax=Sinosporangium album TaxID=504805 RepID=A0A1G8KYN0_9ACTN|nr:putative hydrolase of the HAD superfamily/hydrolase [Sinosporangium album]